MAFSVEDIPNDAILFRKVHEKHFPNGKVSSQAFRHEEMSVNWKKYKPNPQDSADEKSVAVVSLVAGYCRELGQQVVHTPIEPDQPFGPNQSHADVIGDKMAGKGKNTVDHKLRESSQIVWRRDQP